MKTATKLKELCRDILRLVGTGYTHYKIVRIPSDKAYKTHEILLKIQNHYQTNLTRGMRHKRRAKKIANYGAIFFRDTIFIFRTAGENQDKENEFQLIGKKMEFKLSDLVGLVLHKDERDVWTFRLSQETFQFFKGEYHLAFKHGIGKKYHSLESMWRGFPIYHGIGKQYLELRKNFSDWGKKYSVKFKY